MRRVGLLIAVFWLSGLTWAEAAPFDQLSNRLRDFDSASTSSSGSPQRNQRANYEESFPTESESGPADGIWDEPCGSNSCSCPGGNAWCGWQDTGPPTGFWGRAEALYWWVRGSNTPPLVTTDVSTANIPGALDNGTSSVLFGGNRIDQQGRFGGRFTLGYWFDDCETLGIDSSVLVLSNLQTSYNVASAGSPILARPFFDVQTQQQDAIVIADPNGISGNVHVATGRQVLGGDVNMRRALIANGCRRVEVLAGYRYFHFSEGLNVSSNTSQIDPGTELPFQIAVGDSFATRNNFNGAQLGLNWQATEGRWTLDVLTKVALGANAQRISINGSTTVTVDSASSTSQGGFLALASNSGTFHRNQFAVLPELNVNLRYQLTPLWRVNLGYTFLALTNVVRPGDQVDLRIDPRQFPPPTATGVFPAMPFKSSDVWMQGINWGLECNF